MKALELLRRPEWLTWLVSAVAAGPSLVAAWRQAPLEAGSALAMAVWLAPLVYQLVKSGPLAQIPQAGGRHRVMLTWAALLCLVVGGATDLNVLRHGALALACAAVAPRFDGRLLCWLAGAPAWMPAMGWLTATWSTGPVSFARLMVCAAVAAGYFSSKPASVAVSTTHPSASP